MGRIDPEVVRAFVVQSCAAQGVPVKVTDEATVARARDLLGGAAGRAAGAWTRPADPDAARLQSPHGLDAARVEPLSAGPAGTDDGVVEDRGDDGVLSGQP